jgi:hypothetical protein
MPEPNSDTKATRQGNVARNLDVPHNPELRRRIPIALRATNSNGTATRVTCSKCLSDGAIAGISIGAGIVGVLVVFLVAWFLWGRKGAVTKRRSSHMSAPVTDSTSKDHDVSESNVMSLPTLDLPHNSQSQSTLCDDNLLQRTDDSPVEKEMQHLNKEINRHCESHYHLRPLDVGLDSVVRQFTASGYAKYIGCGPPVSELALLLYNPETRILAIRRLIATVIFSHINWRTSTDLSLLPPQVAAFCQRIVPGGQEARTEDGKSETCHSLDSLVLTKRAKHSTKPSSSGGIWTLCSSLHLTLVLSLLSVASTIFRYPLLTTLPSLTQSSDPVLNRDLRTSNGKRMTSVLLPLKLLSWAFY